MPKREPFEPPPSVPALLAPPVAPSPARTRRSERYHVTTRIGNRTIAFQQPVPDPFGRTAVHIGWRDLLAGLAARGLDVEVIVGGDQAAVDAVLALEGYE